MRFDGRKNDELRTLNFFLDYLKYPDGSVLVELGDTKVLCTITMEERVPSFMQIQGKGWITSEYNMIPGAGEPRIPRDIYKGRVSGRNTEIQRMIGRVLRSLVDLTLIPERTLWVDCDVLQADGGTRVLSVIGSFVSLNLALIKYLKEGSLLRWPLKEFIGATSVALVGGEILLDPNYSEDKEAQIDMNVVSTDSGHLLEINASAETSPYSLPVFNEMLEVAFDGIEKIISIEKDILRPSFEVLPQEIKKLIPEEYYK